MSVRDFVAPCAYIIDISYTLDSASHPAGERKLKPDSSRILREAAILVVPTERDNLYILYWQIAFIFRTGGVKDNGKSRGGV